MDILDRVRRLVPLASPRSSRLVLESSGRMLLQRFQLEIMASSYRASAVRVSGSAPLVDLATPCALGFLRTVFRSDGPSADGAAAPMNVCRHSCDEGWILGKLHSLGNTPVSEPCRARWCAAIARAWTEACGARHPHALRLSCGGNLCRRRSERWGQWSPCAARTCVSAPTWDRLRPSVVAAAIPRYRSSTSMSVSIGVSPSGQADGISHPLRRAVVSDRPRWSFRLQGSSGRARRPHQGDARRPQA